MAKSMPTYSTVDDYILNQSVDAQKILKELREIILETVPETVEIQNSKTPNFKLVPESKSNQQLMMAAYAKFVSFYPFPTTVEHFSDRLKDFKLGKGSIQIPFDSDIPKDLFKEIILYRKNEIEN